MSVSETPVNPTNPLRRMLSPTRCIALVMSIVIIASLYRRMDRGSLQQVLQHLDPR